MEELKRIHRQVGTTIIYVSHNQTEAMTLSDRIALLNRGKLEQYDTPRMVYDYPATLYAASFIGSPTMNVLNGRVKRKEDGLGVETLLGFFCFDKEIAALLEPLVETEVKIGIRPQHIAYAEHYSARRSTDIMITVAVELVQSLGDRSLVVGKADKGVTMRFLVSREHEIGPDQTVRAFIDGRKIHLFDRHDNNMLTHSQGNG